MNTIGTNFNDPSSIVKALHNQDALLCCVSGGATKFTPQKVLIDAAIEAGVKLFFASEFASDVPSPHYQIFPPEFVGDKIKVRHYLEEKAAANEIAYTAWNGGPFFDMCRFFVLFTIFVIHLAKDDLYSGLNKGVAGFDIPARKAKIFGSGNNLSCWTPVPVIATAAVNMLRNSDHILDRAIFVSGVEGLTQNSILAALEAETGDIFEVEHVDVKQIKRDAFTALERQELRQAVRGMTLNLNFNEEDSVANSWGKVENELVGVKAVGVREAVSDYLKP